MNCRRCTYLGAYDIVVLPVILVPVFLHHVVEYLFGLEGITTGNDTFRIFLTLHYHHFGTGGVRRREETAFPVTLETDFITDVIQASLFTLLAIGNEEVHLLRTGNAIRQVSCEVRQQSLSHDRTDQGKTPHG